MVNFQAQDIAVATGKVLRQLRKDAGLSQEALSFKALIQRNFVSEIELGQKQPSLFTVFKLADALDIQPNQFVQLVSDELRG